MYDSNFVDLIERYKLICGREFGNSAFVVTVRLVRTVDYEILKFCFNKRITICICVAVILFLLFDLPTILAFEESVPNPPHSTY